ncbi:MAG TPA: hypothetical protein VG941_02275 [Candidatus Paceibacterota bacterium]|nr:hypothetical protein [Candidatus Paceibacterota bacterium]
MKNLTIYKYTFSVITALSLVAAPLAPTFAAGISDPNGMVCDALIRVGMSCGSGTTPTYTPSSYQPKPITLSYDIFGSSSSTSQNVPTSNVKDPAGNAISLVQVPGTQEIYALVNGHKHWIPTLAVLYNYGYTLDMVEPITQAQLDRYPRASLIQIAGDSKHTYYLTEGGMTRVIPNQKIFESYGDRTEDVIVVSQKEFNYYPTNQYVFLENPLNRDVFQVTSAGKRYLTPMAVARLGLRAEQVAPINQTELDYYKTLAPIVN